MATYTELYILSSDPTLHGKLCAAIAVVCDQIRLEDPATPKHDARVVVAQRAITNVDGMARNMIWLLLAINREYLATQILDASDTAIQNAVNSAIDLLV